MNFDKLKKDKKNVLLGCCGNKYNEYNKYLKNIILDNIKKDYIFVEPFCGSSIISYNLYMTNNIKCHINDYDHFRIEFFNKCRDINYMNDINNILLNIKNIDDYNKLINKKLINKEYNSYIFSRLHSSYRYGIYDEKRKFKLLNLNWCDFLNNCIISNDDWLNIIDKYKDDENAFIYLDPPYLNSCNRYYINYNDTYKDEKRIDNTKIYVDIIKYLKDSKCKILMSINDNFLTRYIYKDYINNNYNMNYNYTHINNNEKKKNNESILIISNFLN